MTGSSMSCRFLFACMISLVLAVGCTPSTEELEYSRAEKASQANDQEGALKHYKAVVDRFVQTDLALKSAKEAARISHYELKRYPEAIGFYKHIILYSPNAADRVEAQRKLADLHFNQTLDYKQAIVEYSRLLELPHSPKDDLSYRLNIARAYFYLNNFYQARVEIDTIISRGSDKDMLFEAMLLKANIFLTTKQLDDAILALNELMTKYPDRSKTETIGLILAVTYEEQKNFAKAIETLEAIKDIYPRKAFIEQKIKTLRERQSYLPGARGFRK